VVGLRLNERPPNVYFKKKSSGPVSISSTCALESISESDVRQLLHEYKINSAEAPLRRCESRSCSAHPSTGRCRWQVLFREDCTVDQFIDLIEGNRKYVRCLYVYNKIDMSSIEECRRIMAILADAAPHPAHTSPCSVAALFPHRPCPTRWSSPAARASTPTSLRSGCGSARA